MASCCNCGNDAPELYYYWDAPLEEAYDWRDEFPEADCLCEICFDIANEEGRIKWVDDKNPFTTVC